jgi:hypothetical protein
MIAGKQTEHRSSLITGRSNLKPEKVGKKWRDNVGEPNPKLNGSDIVD